MRTEYFVVKFSKTLTGLKNVVTHVDDILVFSNTIEGLDKCLNAVLNRLMQEGITIKPSKFVLGDTQVSYLGHQLNENGVFVHPERVKAILEFSQPENKTKLLRFLGLVNFIRRHIPNKSQILVPLHALLKGEISFI